MTITLTENVAVPNEYFTLIVFNSSIKELITTSWLLLLSLVMLTNGLFSARSSKWLQLPCKYQSPLY
jgi:hypothetical protein